MMKTYAISVIDYCITNWCVICKIKLEKIDKIILSILRLYPSSKCYKDDDLLEKAGILRCKERLAFCLITNAHKSLLSPPDIRDLNGIFILSQHNRESINVGNLVLPRYDTVCGQRSLSFRTAKLWNKFKSKFAKTSFLKNHTKFKSDIMNLLLKLRKDKFIYD